MNTKKLRLKIFMTNYYFFFQQLQIFGRFIRKTPKISSYFPSSATIFQVFVNSILRPAFNRFTRFFFYWILYFFHTTSSDFYARCTRTHVCYIRELSCRHLIYMILFSHRYEKINKYARSFSGRSQKKNK